MPVCMIMLMACSSAVYIRLYPVGSRVLHVSEKSNSNNSRHLQLQAPDLQALHTRDRLLLDSADTAPQWPAGVPPAAARISGRGPGWAPRLAPLMHCSCEEGVSGLGIKARVPGLQR